ncbi:uncharacterized protein [Physcomitrium patens]|uniref:Alpha 1,4-glycosyltransferase domain-containing protein n=1 Tax=Physcomitrium patens TaxID=3218 RepID=A0A7I4EKV7_PHYPA|nr:uncharacterized protein LOC112286443 [Physcomitrium patens]XP_024384097.1 uncharacterized protein LOC112286443 [Physcomitrium patens]XP_024384098.1 uncharacterized protein LOC112286443 [Physcomitrium patens]XP_024384099.1 uncharacterized protein LOC112286443 [Physcomitrium patens]XP_024384101.1 uncharacterized protein LOC112286443 [Physcomitrium patens]XP_024384102.1 uncharacterized protein LOC112286443 [Physcomitrium patens]|eukprot:XP_024384096.1 uncharacterized protein LOC112286443 [Physcomitrella patens]
MNCGFEQSALMSPHSGSPPKRASLSRNIFRRQNFILALPTILLLYLLGVAITFMVCVRTFRAFNIYRPAYQEPLQLFRFNTMNFPWRESLTAVHENEYPDVLREPRARARALQAGQGVDSVNSNLEILLDPNEPDFMHIPTQPMNMDKTDSLQVSLRKMTTFERKSWLRDNWDNFQILKLDNRSDQFEDRMRRFLCGESDNVMNSQTRRLLMASNSSSESNVTDDTLMPVEAMNNIDEQRICQKEGNDEKGNFCTKRFFITWMSPVSSFGPRERLGLQSIFKWHPHACVVILSRTMDSDEGQIILEPFIERGYRIMAVTPNVISLFENLPAGEWFKQQRDGTGDPGCINFMQNMSNIMRLTVLYKYGGIYLDSDVIVLKSFDGLRNVVGAQSRSIAVGEWTRLNNAVLVFDREHPVVYEFLREFVATFDGSKWGWNGPYLVTRVLQKVKEQQWQNCSSVSVLPLEAFYPLNWVDIVAFFHAHSEHDQRWQEKKLEVMNQKSYAIHLWNKKSSHLRVEKGSILESMFKRSCLFCNGTAS